MIIGRFHYRARSTRQDGYILLVLMLMAALVMVGLAVELPAIGTQIRRDREVELIHRGAQYARAIKHYYVKFHTYPISLDQLQNTNNIRFLRRKYKDPLTGKDFRLLHFGDVQLSLKTPGASTGPGVAATPTGQQQPGAATQPQPFGGPQPQPLGGQGPTFGGGPIIGVASTSEKASLHVFNEKDHYKDWEFIYDPTQDRGGLIRTPYNGNQMQSAGTIPGANPPGQPTGASPFGQGPGGAAPNPPAQPNPR